MAHSLEDICIWADGTTATYEEVLNGEFSFMSDDYQIIDLDEYNSQFDEMDEIVFYALSDVEAKEYALYMSKLGLSNLQGAQ